jgi:hypothetical protein
MPDLGSSNNLNADFSAADSRDVFKTVLQQYGFTPDQITSLTNQVISWGSTYNATQIVNDLLPTSQEYQNRFAGNADRVKAGLPALSPSAYLALESSYSQIAKTSGLPAGFYDTPDAMARLIGSDVSPTEFNDRVTAAKSAIANTDPYYTQALQQMYGLDNGTMLAHILDPEAAAPIVERQANAAQYGAAALAQGLAINPQNFEQYASGVGTGVNAVQGMEQVASITPDLANLAAISGDKYNQSTAEAEVFGGLASAKRKREQLVGQEQNRFTGRSNVDSKSLQGNVEGAF